MNIDWQPIILTLQLATITTFFLWLISVPLGYWLAYTKSRWRPVIETLTGMPLVLPPTVLGFYLLMAFSPSSALGHWLHRYFGVELVFSFPGLVLASVLYSLPFMVGPIRSGFANLSPRLAEAAYVLGKSKTTTLFKVLLPSIRPSLITGTVLAFAHTIGEFGVVLMIGGNIPGQTRVASIAIYDQVEALQYGQAHLYSFILFVFAFTILLTVYYLNGRPQNLL